MTEYESCDDGCTTLCVCIYIWIILCCNASQEFLGTLEVILGFVNGNMMIHMCMLF